MDVRKMSRTELEEAKREAHSFGREIDSDVDFRVIEEELIRRDHEMERPDVVDDLALVKEMGLKELLDEKYDTEKSAPYRDRSVKTWPSAKIRYQAVCAEIDYRNERPLILSTAGLAPGPEENQADKPGPISRATPGAKIGKEAAPQSRATSEDEDAKLVKIYMTTGKRFSVEGSGLSRVRQCIEMGWMLEVMEGDRLCFSMETGKQVEAEKTKTIFNRDLVERVTEDAS